MSQGSNSSGGGSSGATVAKSIKTQMGREFDISEHPLIYSNPQHGLSQAQVDAIQRFVGDKFEKDRASEYGVILDDNGLTLWSGRGVNGAVSMPITQSETQITGHTHPRKGGDGNQEGKMGGTFSYDDIRSHVDSDKAKTQFAGAYEGIYFMTKQSNFDGSGLKKYSQKSENNRVAEHKDRMKNYEDQYRKGEIDYKSYLNEFYKSFNLVMTGLHNDYLDGQKQFGYTYGLVERKSP